MLTPKTFSKIRICYCIVTFGDARAHIKTRETKHFCTITLTHFEPIFDFYTPWKHQKASGFMFSRNVEVEH